MLEITCGDWCLRLLVRCHRFMEQCVPLGKDPNGPTPRSFSTPQTRAAQEQTRIRKSKFSSRCALTVANIISMDSRKYRGGSAILHFHDKFLSR
jgi:hypothetical protein